MQKNFITLQLASKESVQLELKEATPVEAKATTTDEGVMTFYASVFGNVDSYGDIMVRGAFADAIAEWKANGKYPKFVWNHDWAEPLGKVIDMVEDDFGLKVTVQFVMEVQRAREQWALYKAGAGTDFSFGFSITGKDFDTEGHRLITKVRLYEVSAVLIGANNLTHVVEMKDAEEAAADAQTADPVHVEPAADHSPTPPEEPKEDEKEGGEGVTDEGSGEGEGTVATDEAAKAGVILSPELRALLVKAVAHMEAMTEKTADLNDTKTALEAYLNAEEVATAKAGATKLVEQRKNTVKSPTVGWELLLKNAQSAVKANQALIVSLKPMARK